MMMNRLMTTPSEKANKLAYLHEMSTREKGHAQVNTLACNWNSFHLLTAFPSLQVIKKLEAELRSATDEKEAEVKAKNEIIRRLQADIHHIEKFSEENIKRIKMESEKQQQSDTKNSEGRSQKLEQERSQLRIQLDNLISEHRESESNLRSRKYKLETEVENWLQKYDSDMGDRQVKEYFVSYTTVHVNSEHAPQIAQDDKRS